MKLSAGGRLAAAAVVAATVLGGARSSISSAAPQGPAASLERLVNASQPVEVIDDHTSTPVVPDQPIDAGTAAQLLAQLHRARSAALRYPTVADAKRAGFIEATKFTPGVGAHFMKFSNISGTFDVDNPAMILYDGTTPASRVAGLAYYVISGMKAPDGFAGPNDHWHQHLGVCVTPTGPVEAGDAPETCRFGGRPAWMLHVWVAPSYQSPIGFFSPLNQALAGGNLLLSNQYSCHIKIT